MHRKLYKITKHSVNSRHADSDIAFYDKQVTYYQQALTNTTQNIHCFICIYVQKYCYSEVYQKPHVHSG